MLPDAIPTVFEACNTFKSSVFATIKEDPKLVVKSVMHHCCQKTNTK
jgi:hypothetical protein